MQTTTSIDWRAYNTSAAGRPPRRVVGRAIEVVGDGARRVALDIGAGGGSDSFEFARRGWTVHAYDTDDTIATRMVENERLAGEVRLHVGDVAHAEEFPAADIVYSAYSLPMLGADLPAVWERLRRALRPGGVVAVDLFGQRDSWVEREDIATFSEQEIEEMFRGLEVLSRDVRDEDGRTFSGDKKHWHVISTLARRPR
ncbi:MAG: class I SAM-dependent methyltransferase [Brachybacterium sp.]|nr:class I SAM-dependent methyltransferase [Brachybacterium sp.]